MPANRQDNPSFFGNVNLFSNLSGTSTYADKVLTTQQSQSTPQNSSNGVDNSTAVAATNSGVGAGTSTDAQQTVNADNNPTPTGATTQFAISQTTASLNQLIPTQPNQLDQYASYTYSISWYVLSPAQYNDAITTQQPNVTGWQLLMQSGGAPTKGRSPAFPLDYYMDDLEIESVIPFGGTNMANSATNIRFKVTEPNGITLIQNIFKAVTAVYKNNQQSQPDTTNGTPNYLTAQYCLLIEFYGYDSQGKLIAPARGSASGYGQQAVIAKYYPFRIMDIKFSVANRAIEYLVTGKPIPYSYNSSTDRGTIPFPFTMTGQTVDQLLNGAQITTNATTNQSDPKARKTTPAPNQGIQPGLFVAPVQAVGNINQNQADTLNLLAAGQLGA